MEPLTERVGPYRLLRRIGAGGMGEVFAAVHEPEGHRVALKRLSPDEIDIVVFDRQYSPFIFHYEGQPIVPAESVYAVLEVKQSINAEMVSYAQKKVASVRKLHRTSLPIPHAGGTYLAKPPGLILGGLLSLESEWKPPLGDSLEKALHADQGDGRLDVGCVAAHGHFCFDRDAGTYQCKTVPMPATAFLFELIARLQASATVGMIDVRAYATSLSPGATR